MRWLGPWIVAIAATLAVLLAFGLFGTYVFRSFLPYYAFAGATAIWAALDSRRIGIQRYRTWMSTEPSMILFLCVMFWIPCFACYVAVRQGIKAGLVPLKIEKKIRVFD